MNKQKNLIATKIFLIIAIILVVVILTAKILDKKIFDESIDTTTAEVTTAEVTTAPVTTAEVTTAPVTTAPVTTAEVTTVPVTTVPVTTTPVTSAPVTTVEVTTAPVTTAEVTTAPVTTAEVTTTPVTTTPVTTAPVTTAEVTTAPVTTATPQEDNSKYAYGYIDLVGEVPEGAVAKFVDKDWVVYDFVKTLSSGLSVTEVEVIAHSKNTIRVKFNLRKSDGTQARPIVQQSGSIVFNFVAVKFTDEEKSDILKLANEFRSAFQHRPQ